MSISSGYQLAKSPTGIQGLDEITGGGLPTGRPTLVCGSAGSGKTMLAVEFLVHGATQFGEPGVLMMFEESTAEITANVRSLGHDLKKLSAQNKIRIDHVQIERSEIEETGEYDLEGLFIRIGNAVDSIGAKRVVLDTVEALFAGLPNHAILRAELRRLFRWLKDRGLTAIITGERGDHSLTRYGLEEYVADCVIVLDQRMHEQISTRRLRVLKYRGSAHGTNEYPFIISGRGLSVLPITSLQLDHGVSAQRIPTGIARLDEMLGGKGVYRGSSVLVSGSPGTGKSSIGAKFADTACRRGERVLLFAYEESSAQIVRNMGSIGIDLAQWVKKGLLQIHSSRPTLVGLEEHLLLMHDAVRDFRPSLVVIDPISNLSLDLTASQVKPMLMRLIDFLKRQQITALFASLTEGRGEMLDDSQLGVSSLMDTWLLLRNVEFNGERNRTIYVLKSRGMKHSNQVRELVLSSRGIDLVDVYLGAERVLTGSARVTQEEQERAAAVLRVEEHQHRVKQLASRQKAIAARIAALQAEADAETAEMATTIARQVLQRKNTLQITDTMTLLRGADKTNGSRKKGKR
ncbi:MAG: circadian clock protein KaiC [Burkholderiales bacterium]|nr:circadian clock protein KaiC [Burkholderiales bacterium]MDP2399817.1 circadian clock protein KaiC [Burkholderiales bacterium]